MWRSAKARDLHRPPDPSLQQLSLTLGTGPLSRVEAEKQPKGTEQPDIVAREDLDDRRRRYTLGANVTCRGGGVPNAFPHRAEDSGPSHHLSVIPTASGAASAAAALPRIVTAGGGRSYGILRYQLIRVRNGMPCERASLRLGDA